MLRSETTEASMSESQVIERAGAAGVHPARELLPAVALYGRLEQELLAAMAHVDDADARRETIARAETLVYALHASLDLRDGGELPRRLAALYDYLAAELRDLRRVPDCDRLDDLLGLAATLRSSSHPASRY